MARWKAGCGLREPRLRGERQREMKVSAREGGVAGERPRVRLHRFVVPILRGEGQAEVVPHDRVVGAEAERAPDPLLGDAVVAVLVSDHAEQVPGVGVLRMLAQHAEVAPLGVREPTVLVGGHRAAQGGARSRRRSVVHHGCAMAHVAPPGDGDGPSPLRGARHAPRHGDTKSRRLRRFSSAVARKRLPGRGAGRYGGRLGPPSTEIELVPRVDRLDRLPRSASVIRGRGERADVLFDLATRRIMPGTTLDTLASARQNCNASWAACAACRD